MDIKYPYVLFLQDINFLLIIQHFISRLHNVIRIEPTISKYNEGIKYKK